MAGVNFYLKDVVKENFIVTSDGTIRGNPQNKSIRSINVYFKCRDGKFRKFTDQRINECDWIESDQKRKIFQRVDPKVRGAKDINYVLDEKASRLNKFIRDEESAGRPIYMRDLERLWKQDPVEEEETGPPELFKFLESFILDQAESSKGNYEKLQNHFIAFNAVKKYNVSWDKLNLNFLREYVNFLINDWVNPVNGKRGVLNSTIGKDISSLKKVCREAARSGIMIHPEVLEFKKLSYETKRYSITEEELENKLLALNITALSSEDVQYIISHEKDYRKNRHGKKKGNKVLAECAIDRIKKNLEKARDCYVYGFDTALRYSDMRKLFPHHIVYDADDDNNWVPVIDFGQKKSRRGNIIPLSNRCLAIHEKWKGQQDTVLPIFKHMQGYNKHLKRLFKAAGFNKKVVITRWSGDKEVVQSFEEWQILTPHTSRHSAAEDILDKTGDITVARDFLGHSTVKTTEIYARNSRKKFNSKILNVKNKEPKIKIG